MNDEEAIRRCQDGDREAFRHLVEGYKAMLYGTAYLMTGDGAVAQDRVQEAFISAWRGIRGFQTGRPLKPWLVRILVNNILSQRRRRRVSTISLEEGAHRDSAGEAGELAEDMERREQVRRALGRLSEEHRQVVMLRYFADLSVPDISKVLGCREGTVKSRLHRALEQLRHLLLMESGFDGGRN